MKQFKFILFLIKNKCLLLYIYNFYHDKINIDHNVSLYKFLKNNYNDDYIICAFTWNKSKTKNNLNTYKHNSFIYWRNLNKKWLNELNNK